MFLRSNKRFKDGKEHRYWSVVENRRVIGGRSIQKTLLYLGEINDSDRSAMADLLDDDFRLAAIDTLYRCHDRLLVHREALFIHLKER